MCLLCEKRKLKGGWLLNGELNSRITVVHSKFHCRNSGPESQERGPNFPRGGPGMLELRNVRVKY